MALQDGFKITGVTVVNGGGGYGHNITYSVTARDRVGQGSGFAGKVKSTNGVLGAVSITTSGKNYSSGSWEGLANNTGTPAIKGNFTTLAITSAGGDVAGSGSILIPVITMDSSISINDINVERGFSGTTANSDIHDLYNDFASVGGLTDGGAATDVFNATETWNKPNFDWYVGGPVSGANDQDNVIRFDEFYGATYDSYGGNGCLALGTRITMADGTLKKIEDINIGEYVKSAQIPGVPLDFDGEDTWKDWTGVPHGNAPNNVWATAYYDIQEMNRVSPVSASVFDIYYDFYDSYFLVNDKIKATWEHPFFVLRNGNYSFQQTLSLKVGDKVFTTENDFIDITSVVRVDEELETVNINCEPYDVYFAEGILLHNVHDKDA
tara:strand:- start:2062 stop:3204 length:1143 start_codon:yes stop_codon:yes gene_type:complete